MDADGFRKYTEGQFMQALVTTLIFTLKDIGGIGSDMIRATFVKDQSVYWVKNRQKRDKFAKTKTT